MFQHEGKHCDMQNKPDINSIPAYYSGLSSESNSSSDQMYPFTKDNHSWTRTAAIPSEEEVGMVTGHDLYVQTLILTSCMRFRPNCSWGFREGCSKQAREDTHGGTHLCSCGKAITQASTDSPVYCSEVVQAPIVILTNAMYVSPKKPL